MKRWIALLLAGIMIFGFAACAAKNTAPEEPPKPAAGERLAVCRSLSELLAGAREEADRLEEQARSAMTQTDMNLSAADRYALWDRTLNELCSALKPALNDSEKAALEKDQEEWSLLRDKKAEDAAAEYQGGSMQPMVEDDTAADLTRVRCYAVAALAGPEMVCAITESFGVQNGEFGLGYKLDRESLQKTDAGYEGTVTVYKPVLVPEQFSEGSFCSVCTNELEGSYELLECKNGVLIGEDGTEYSIRPNGTGKALLVHDSEDLLEVAFYQGAIRIAENAVFRIDIEGREEPFDPESGMDYFNGAAFSEDGTLTAMTFYGD